MKTTKQLPTEDIAEMWRDDSQGEYIQINDKGEAWYVAHGRAMERIQPRGNIWTGIRDWMNQKHFWPNIWSVNDHGNVELLTRHGKSLGGLV